MKKIKAVFKALIFAGLTSLCLTSVISCKDSFMSHSEQSEKAYIQIGSTIARTANPVVSLSSLNSFTLKGTKSGSSETTLGTWTSASSMTSANIEISTGTWNFTLTASNDGANYSANISNKSISTGSNTLSFVLALVSYVTTGSGDFNLTLVYPADSNVSVTGELLTYPALASVSGYSAKTLSSTTGASTYSAVYSGTSVSSGTYLAKFVFYKDNVQLNSVYELVNIANSLTSTGTLTVTDLADLYSITYNLNNGAFADSYTAPLSFSINSAEIKLPVADNLTYAGYTFGGWYEESDFSGTAVTSIAAGTTENKTFYAKWTASVTGETTNSSSNYSMALYSEQKRTEDDDGNVIQNNAITSVSVSDDGDNLIVTVYSEDGFNSFGNSTINVLVDNVSCDSSSAASTVMSKNASWPTVDSSYWPTQGLATTVTEASGTSIEAWAQTWVQDGADASSTIGAVSYITYIASATGNVQNGKSGKITVTDGSSTIFADDSTTLATLNTDANYVADFGTDTLVYTIPLSCIGGAVKGDELRVAVVRSEYYYDSDNSAGVWTIDDVCPWSVTRSVSDSETWSNSGDTETELYMENAICYTVVNDSASSGGTGDGGDDTPTVETNSYNSSSYLTDNVTLSEVTVTDDGTYLIVTATNDNGWSFYQNYGVHVLVDNTNVNSTTSIFSASNPWYENSSSSSWYPQTLSTSSYQAESTNTSVEAWASMIIDSSGYANPVCTYIKTAAGSLNEAEEISVYAGTTQLSSSTSYTASSYLYSLGETTLTFYIPLSYIGSASSGNELKVVVVTTGYDDSTNYRNYVADACPATAVRDSSDAEFTPAWSCQYTEINLSDYGISHTLGSSSSSGGSSGSGDADYMRGVDISMLYDLEADGAIFYDANGNSSDMLKILADAGVNWVRIRVWNNPSSSTSTPGLSNYGYCTIEKAASLGARAKALGMNILLDLHYSDTWADPSYQLVPYAWRSYTSVSSLASAMATFTTSCLTTMTNAGASVDMIQLGNEINIGLFVQSYSNGTPKVAAGFSSNSSNFTTCMTSAISAVRSYDSSIKIMLHLAHTTSSLSWSYGYIKNLDFDVLGFSYYPCISSHGTISTLASNIKTYVSAGKEVVIAETSYPWTVTQYANDGVSNTLWYYDSSSSPAVGTYCANTNLTSVASTYGLTTTTYSSKTCLNATAAMQKNVITAIMTEVKNAGGSGVFYWGGEWVSNSTSGSSSVASGGSGIGSTWENQALFDLDHQALSALDAFANQY